MISMSRPSAAASVEPAKPIVKYVGGKTKLLPELLKRMPSSYERYFEPFCGGAALFFRVAPKRAVIGDMNSDLIAMYRAVSHDVEDVIGGLRFHRRQHSELHYYMMRESWNVREAAQLSDREKAPLFIYLNKTCFNGLWRVNKAGAFNVSMGRYENPTICDADGLRAAAKVLARAEIRCGSYLETLRDAGPGDFVYADCPYDGTFTGYTADAFGADDQQVLAETARELVARGCKVMLSNADTKRVRSLYRGFKISRVKRPGTMNSDPARRGKVGELFITGGY